MQRFFLLVFSLLMIAISNAQVKKGNFIAEGNIGSISMGKNDTKYLSESFSNTSEGKDFAILIKEILEKGSEISVIFI